MAEEPPDSPRRFAALVRNALLKGFSIPVALLGFYAIAPTWLNHNLQGNARTAIEADRSLTVRQTEERVAFFTHLDFEKISRQPPKGLERLKANLDEGGITDQFWRLRAGAYTAGALVGLLAAVAFATIILNRQAKRSRDDLIRAYRLAWKLSVGAALTKIVLLIPLLSYGIFELTTLAMERYFPKLILIIVIGGVIALWKGSKILLQRVPLEYTEDMARPILSDEAPELWAEIRRAATALKTNPPDHILVGMQLNFYVTEMTVNYSGGRLEGRTLYLSLPLLRQLGIDEVMAIVGHELGHFRGDDTQLTRVFYPMRFKVDATLHALAQSGWVGWSSLHALLFFRRSFGETEQQMSREREFLADRAGAELTSAEIAARALIKTHVYTKAFTELVRKQTDGADDIFATPLAPFIKSTFGGGTQFWSDLMATATPHPLDSHPPLKLRLTALGAATDPVAAAEIAVTEATIAYDAWLLDKGDLFDKIVQRASNQMTRMRSRMTALKADYTTKEGQQLLESHFPPVQWKSRASGLWIKIIGCIFGAGLSILLAAVSPMPATLIPIALGCCCLACAVQQWRRHHDGEFILKADSLNYSGWSHPLLFSEVVRINTRSSYGTLVLYFILREKAPSIWRFSTLSWMRTKKVTLPLGLIAGKQSEIFRVLHKYMTRNIEAA